MKQTIDYNKLVRDNVPTIVGNEIPIYYTLNDEQYWQSLLNKDAEELQKIKIATTKDKIKEKLADKLEILIEMAKLNDFSLENIIKKADIKRQKHGGFSKKSFLKEVIFDE